MSFIALMMYSGKPTNYKISDTFDVAVDNLIDMIKKDECHEIYCKITKENFKKYFVNCNGIWQLRTEFKFSVINNKHYYIVE